MMYGYASDIIDRITDHPYKRIDELLLWNVKLWGKT